MSVGVKSSRRVVPSGKLMTGEGSVESLQRALNGLGFPVPTKIRWSWKGGREAETSWAVVFDKLPCMVFGVKGGKWPPPLRWFCSLPDLVGDLPCQENGWGEGI